MMRCRVCSGSVELVDDNGVVDPEKKRIEFYRCIECSHRQKVELTP
jgi:uncharacterized protein with PIN domain